MFENRQLAVFVGKCRRFRNSSECLKTHCGSNSWPIWTQKVSKEAYRCAQQTFMRVFSKIFCCTWRVGCQKFSHYICTYVLHRMVYFEHYCISLRKDEFEEFVQFSISLWGFVCFSCAEMFKNIQASMSAHMYWIHSLLGLSITIFCFSLSKKIFRKALY